jgi:hypothetical protein
MTKTPKEMEKIELLDAFWCSDSVDKEHDPLRTEIIKRMRDEFCTVCGAILDYGKCLSCSTPASTPENKLPVPGPVTDDSIYHSPFKPPASTPEKCAYCGRADHTSTEHVVSAMYPVFTKPAPEAAPQEYRVTFWSMSIAMITVCWLRANVQRIANGPLPLSRTLLTTMTSGQNCAHYLGMTLGKPRQNCWWNRCAKSLSRTRGR